MGLKPRHQEASARQLERVMSLDEFWRIIEVAGQRARRADDDDDQQRFEIALREILRKRGPDAVAAFDHHFGERMRAAYHYDLWDAVYLVNQGCGDDGFHDFRAWLISMGRDIYERTVQHPDSLARLLEQPDSWLSFHEGLSGLAERLYEEMTGRVCPDPPGSRHWPSPKGVRYPDDAMELEHRFPALWALFGKHWRSSD